MAKPKPARTGPSLGQEVIALAILGTGILLLLALFSFDPRDLAFYAQPAQDPKANLVGPAGQGRIPEARPTVGHGQIRVYSRDKKQN